MRNANTPRAKDSRIKLDGYVLVIVATVAFGLLLPCPPQAQPALGLITRVSIALLFFFYGARLTAQAVWQGLLNWRLQGLVLAATFVLFPALGLAARLLVPSLLSPDLYVGLLFLCLLPSTVQSSLAFIGLARGNVGAAVSASSASGVIGVVVTPVLAALLLDVHGAVSASGLWDVVLLLQLPFFTGQLVRRWIAKWIERHRLPIGWADRLAVLLIVYMAISTAAGRGAWGTLRPFDLVSVVLVCPLLLALALAISAMVSRALRLPIEDEIVVVFCGGNKSLVTGVPMLTALLPPDIAGVAVLPLIVFHQIQLIVCAGLASWYARRARPS